MSGELISPYTPAIPSEMESPESLGAAIQALRETIDLREARVLTLELQKSVTLQDLIDLGLITEADVDNKLR